MLLKVTLNLLTIKRKPVLVVYPHNDPQEKTTHSQTELWDEVLKMHGAIPTRKTGATRVNTPYFTASSCLLSFFLTALCRCCGGSTSLVAMCGLSCPRYVES